MQIEWAANHVTFRAWNGWSNVPTVGHEISRRRLFAREVLGAADIIHEWTYTGVYIPRADGNERVGMNLWLSRRDEVPSGYAGCEMIINSFSFQ